MTAFVLAVAIVTVGALWGGMLFFAAVFAPLVFIKLDAETAGRFIRQIFPVYYLSMGIVSVVAAIAISVSPAHGTTDALAMILVCLGFWFARRVLMPRINLARDADLEGDSDAKGRFKRLHRASVLINAVQMLAVLVVLIRFVWS